VRLVLDTNVLVSGLLSPYGPPGRVVDLVFAARVVVLADDRILGEYADVLARPKFAFRADDVRDVLEYLRVAVEPVVASPLGVELPDRDDLPFLEVAAAGGADALVTGNTRDFAPTKGHHDIRVVTAAEFLTLVGEGP